MAGELTIRIAGEAGQGMQTIGSVLCRTFKNSGLFIFANQDYMSRVRGGNNFFQIRTSDKPLYTLRGKADIIIALDKRSVDIHKDHIAPGGIIILDKKKFGISDNDPRFFNIPLYDMAASAGGSEIFVNTVSCGVAVALTGINFNSLEAVIIDAFEGKDESVVNKNVSAARAGYDFAKENFKDGKFFVKTSKAKDTILLNGNEAIAIGAIRGGCKFYSAYPMTPSTSIMDTVAHYADKFGILVEQAEDEIAAVNMVLGASFAGVRSMTGTSGGGFALMVEGVSLAGMTETPIVIVDSQRPAPATGFPTRTEAADLNFILHSGHGEFARAVYSPGTTEELFYLTVKAFNIAEKYQIPVFILTDQHLADSYRNIGAFDAAKAEVKRHIISKEDSKNVSGYKRYLLNESGISPRAVPSWINDVIYADSDEHTEEGHITEDAGMRTKMVEKRFYKKMAGLSKEAEKPASYNMEGAGIVLVGFGSTFGVMKEACESIKGVKSGFVHLSQVWPFPSADMVRLLKDARNVVTVENNAGAQLAKLLRRETGIEVSGSILKYDGRPFDLDAVTARVEEICKR